MICNCKEIFSKNPGKKIEQKFYFEPTTRIEKMKNRTRPNGI
jgi:hypothetical protein